MGDSEDHDLLSQWLAEITPPFLLKISMTEQNLQRWFGGYLVTIFIVASIPIKTGISSSTNISLLPHTDINF